MGQIENKWQDGRPKSNLLTVTLNVYELNTTIKKLIFTLHLKKKSKTQLYCHLQVFKYKYSTCLKGQKKIPSANNK